LLIKYIKSLLWRLAERLSYIEDAWRPEVKLFCQFDRASATAKFHNNLFSISVMYINNISILHGHREAFDLVYLQRGVYGDHPEQGGQPVTAGIKLTGRTELWRFARSSQ
jgi:hypothetical protein